MASLIEIDFANLRGGTLDTSLLETLAGVGNHGSAPQHCHSEMVRRLPASNMPLMGCIISFFMGVSFRL